MSSQQTGFPGLEPGTSRTYSNSGQSPLHLSDQDPSFPGNGTQANTGSGSAPGNDCASQQQQQQHAKRTRVVLSCAPCRASKLKCDRSQPCTLCVKKGRPDECAYAPRREKARPAKSMAARLKRLEGMVREMMPGEGGEVVGEGEQISAESGDSSQRRGQVVVASGGKTTTYVGATHFMAMLDDVSGFVIHNLESLLTRKCRLKTSKATSKTTRYPLMAALSRAWMANLQRSLCSTALSRGAGRSF